MSTTDQVDIMLFVESLDDFLTESERNATIIFSPSLHILIRVRPKQVAQQAGIRNICGPHDSLDLFKRVHLGGESSMHAQDFLVNQRSNGQAVEAISESFPNSDVEPPFAFIIEPVNSVNRGALVISPQQEKVLRVLDLVSQEEADGFEGLFATIYVVAEEEVVRLWWEAAVLEKPEQVEELPVHVA